MRDDGHALVGDDVPPPKFVHTPRSTPRVVQEPIFMKSRVPEVLSHAGVYPLGTQPSRDPNAHGAEAKIDAEEEEVCVVKPVAPGFPAGAIPREPVPKWVQRSSGYESVNSPLAGLDTYDPTRRQDEAPSKQKVSLSSGATGRGGQSQIVFGASAKRRTNTNAKSNALTMNAESAPPPTLAELAKKRTAASMAAGARKLASQINFSAAPLRSSTSSSKANKHHPGGRCLNYESAPGGPIAAIPPPKYQSSNQDTFNVSSALSAIVFGGRQSAEKRKDALGRVLVTAGQKHGTKYLNYRSEEKPYRAGGKGSNSSASSKPGWLSSKGVTELVFSGVQRPVRPQQQQFPHGRSFGSSTLKLV